ncbi:MULTISPECIES: ABC transporter ATP-binding protein [unclassified Mesorhizobium]|uniref:ABC transporter ATP-binding protein n=1 Tax=unclassified Mesorhizobium TaxID=325217 RepID=UPI0011264F34|nr:MULTISPECIES: ABC transporter ATP-binding protein [unclassified Mesorhizobium]TPJ48937.1 ABC transporter ATP-binding protein [Mesorhizobium sp. B2-6-6]MBZ9703016.1 ABC transporter ATP-binding protein [Mesorhizobium sp. CO1-1-3]MBZ9897972.1 ABC transporter ATP-binding protein [Mesorhizobium sp. BR1-1-6]MBZ9920070.1 ABC transporter ATP-binding protein [Mesorhizobium sp. BR1-1-7]MBZ9949882.1 ABC transporter ATP-binding protein [Mesorhizobium sp. BR1-1-11]
MDRIVVSDIKKTFLLKPGQFVTVDGEETDRVTVLDGVDLSIRKGEFITLVGPSGSGKSVLLDIIGGLTQASGGDVQLDGRRITRPDPKTGYVFQQYALFPWRTALANIEYALEVRGVAKAERTVTARHLLSLFGLAGFEDRFPNQLSGGMQQRVAIARALASNPEVLLMDEPFAALDQQTRELLQGELLRIWGKIKTTVIFVTHSIDEAIFLADRVVVMTARPGAVKEIIDIDLPRPRDGDIRASAGFNGYRGRVWDALRDEVNKAQKDWTLSPAFSH